MKTTPIKTGTLGTKNSVFVAFYTKAYHHYQTNEECRNWGESAWNSKIALLGFAMRWDASFGFVGGKVDEGETLVQAAVRETMEEVGTTITEEQLTLMCSHEMEDGDFHQNTHLYLCEVTPDEIYNIRTNSATSEHGRVEAAAFNVVHMVDDAYKNLRQLPWAGTAREELELLLNSGLIDAPKCVDNGTF
jgi:8-oxo-dGTP pyrophosphatase MutT (NUDIX family)